MPDSHSLWLFAGAALALLLIPGRAVLYIVAHGNTLGQRSITRQLPQR